MTARSVLDNLRYEVCSRCHGYGILTIEDLNALPRDREIEVDFACPACKGEPIRLVPLRWRDRIRRAFDR